MSEPYRPPEPPTSVVEEVRRPKRRRLRLAAVVVGSLLVGYVIGGAHYATTVGYPSTSAPSACDDALYDAEAVNALLLDGLEAVSRGIDAAAYGDVVELADVTLETENLLGLVEDAQAKYAVTSALCRSDL